ncbi:MAG: hypothetical protein M3R49_04790 [Chloroflexota bacterium]|nr:hypothetical protein [Chloroflexota bacterium]MDQ2941942.1 hypothetical protein [Chloroflexota bacterium]
MSKGRSRHQASRRRMYSARQRELRERRVNAAMDEQHGLGDGVAAIEVEEGLDFEAPTSWTVREGRASAA